MNAAKRNQTDMRLAVLAAVRSPAKFAHADIAQAIGCGVEVVEEIAALVELLNPEPTSPMTQEEIAQIIGISPQAVGQVEHVAMQRLHHPSRMRILMEARAAMLAC
jgi:DNA-directed RNA polymerase sigma subunit (sigma70/sigma32)